MQLNMGARNIRLSFKIARLFFCFEITYCFRAFLPHLSLYTFQVSEHGFPGRCAARTLGRGWQTRAGSRGEGDSER